MVAQSTALQSRSVHPPTAAANAQPQNMQRQPNVCDSKQAFQPVLRNLQVVLSRL